MRAGHILSAFLGFATLALAFAGSLPSQRAEQFQGSEGCGPDAYTPNYVQTMLVDDDPEAGTGELAHWDHFPLAICFLKTSNWTAQRQTDALQGFNLWTKAVPQVRFDVVANPDDADITVEFVTPRDLDWAFGDTKTTYSRRTHVLRNAVTRLTTGNRRYTLDDAISTAGHEFGHALGIEGHSPNVDDIMTDVETVDVVTKRDSNTLLTAYCGRFGTSGPPTVR